jgi:oxygen-dependent protoporphyrinogen oxidase
LSAKSTAPEVYAIAAGHRSVYASLRKRRASAPTPTGSRRAPLVSLDGGLGRLTTALVEAIGHSRIRTGVAALRVRRDGTWTADTDAGPLSCDTLVIAIPAHAAAALLEPASTRLAALLRDIPFVDVANATLAFCTADMPDLPRGTGFLVPPAEGRFIVGCTWLTNKWPYLANDRTALVKAMVGRAGDRRWLDMTDAEIVDGVRADLNEMLGLAAQPFDTLVQRWPKAMPQYVAGHDARVGAMHELASELGGLHLTGASYGGSGLAACVAQGRATARTIAEGVQA